MIRAMLAALALVVILPASPATAREVRPADHTVTRVRVVKLERIRPHRVRATLNTGAVHILAPCHWEDSRTCYWDAARRGNHIGRSFVDIRGHVYYIRIPR